MSYRSGRRGRKAAGSRSLAKGFLIVTEGATEAGYFKKFKRMPDQSVEIVDGQDSKLSLVRKAVDLKEAQVKGGNFFPEVDSCWVVFDRDVNPQNKQDKDQFNQALQLASNNVIQVAWSNDAFELWLLLHFQNVSSAISRDILNSKLSDRLGAKYEKARGAEIFDAIDNNRSLAIQRAVKMEELLESLPPVDANPCTLVHKLVIELTNGPEFRD